LHENHVNHGSLLQASRWRRVVLLMRLPERFYHRSLSLDNAAEFDIPSILRSLFYATRMIGRSFGRRGRRDGASGGVVYDDGLTGVVDAFEDGGDVAGVGGGEVALCCCLNHCGTSILSAAWIWVLGGDLRVLTTGYLAHPLKSQQGFAPMRLSNSLRQRQKAVALHHQLCNIRFLYKP
jgi:hypothetical protein